MTKDKLIAGVVAAILVLVPLGGLFAFGATVGGVVSGAASTVKTLPVNCKAPPNIFDAWETFQDFVTGVDCNQCPVAEVTEGGNTETNANKAEYVQSIIGVGNAMKIPEKGIVVALATALQESGLKNYANDGAYDLLRNPADGTLGTSAKASGILAFAKRSMGFPHDAVGSDATSVGLFQQQAWWGTMGGSTWENDPEGTIKRLMDPTFQSQKFYNSLLKVPGWESMSHGVAAQKVQVSAFPDAYAQRVPEAQSLYNQNKDKAKEVKLYDFGESFTGGSGGTGGNMSDAGNCAGSGATSTGIVLEKSALYQVTAQFAQPRGAELYGSHAGMDIDCGNDFEDVFSPISGVVTIATNGNPSGYGNPAGDLMIKTQDGTVIQLHHMRNVFVKAGDQVKGGQRVGECASTGMSTGTHLHIQAYVQNSTNPKIKNLPVASNIAQPLASTVRDPALVLEILGVDICPPYTANRKNVSPGADLPGGIMKCWPPNEWTR